MLYYSKCEDRKEVPQFPYLCREPTAGGSRRGETGNTFREQRTKRIFYMKTHGCDSGEIPVGCDGTFPLQDKGIDCVLPRRFSISADA